MASNKAWNKIFSDYKISDHDFDNGPFELTADQIKNLVRLLLRQETRNQEYCANRIRVLIDLPFLLTTDCSSFPKRMGFTISSKEKAMWMCLI